MHWANWWDWPSHQQILGTTLQSAKIQGAFGQGNSKLCHLCLPFSHTRCHSKGWDCCSRSPVAIMVVPSLATTCLSHSTPLHLRHWLLPSDPLLILPPELTMNFLSVFIDFCHLGPRSDPGPSCHSPPCSDPESRGYLQHFLSSDTLLLFNY